MATQVQVLILVLWPPCGWDHLSLGAEIAVAVGLAYDSADNLGFGFGVD